MSCIKKSFGKYIQIFNLLRIKNVMQDVILLYILMKEIRDLIIDQNLKETSITYITKNIQSSTIYAIAKRQNVR